MPINRAPFNALIDDDGSGTSGTPWNKTQIAGVLLDPIDAALLPGGATTQLQFNDAGIFNGDPGLTYNKGTDALTVGGLFTANGFGTHSFSAGGTGFNVLNVRNTSAGSTNLAILDVGNDVASNRSRVISVSSTYASAGRLVADGGSFETLGAGGTSVAALHPSGVIRFYTGGDVERARLTSTGQFTLTNNETSYGMILGCSNASPAGLSINYTSAAPNNASGNYFFVCGDTGATRFLMRSNGGLLNYQANDVNLSDADVKDIVGAADVERGRFAQLHFVRARYQDSPQIPYDVMLTAQDVQRVYPDLVGEFAGGLLGVREHGIIMRGLKVVQEHDAIIETLLARIEELERTYGPE